MWWHWGSVEPLSHGAWSHHGVLSGKGLVLAPWHWFIIKTHYATGLSCIEVTPLYFQPSCNPVKAALPIGWTDRTAQSWAFNLQSSKLSKFIFFPLLLYQNCRLPYKVMGFITVSLFFFVTYSSLGILSEPRWWGREGAQETSLCLGNSKLSLREWKGSQP